MLCASTSTQVYASPIIGGYYSSSGNHTKHRSELLRYVESNRSTLRAFVMMLAAEIIRAGGRSREYEQEQTIFL
jgi:hypothetical protein